MKLSVWQRWHRATGLAAAVFIVLLCISGFVLNHADRLGLPQRHVSAAWLLDWYGIEPPPPVAFAAGDRWVTLIGERLYVDRHEAAFSATALAGAVVAQPDGIVVAADDRIAILSETGETIEILGAEQGVPAGIRSIAALADGRIAIAAEGGLFLGNLNPLAWDRTEAADFNWAAPAQPPADLLEELLKSYRGAGLTVERLLLDLHSGRMFGTVGVWVVDLAGLLFVFLAASGVWMWLRRPTEWADDTDDGSADS